MRLWRRVFVVVALLVMASLVVPGQARAVCTRVADLPLHVVDGYVLVPATVAGTPVQFLLDTGAEDMLIEPAIADALQLPLRGMIRIYGTGGSQDAQVVSLPGLRLGDAALPARSAPVAALPITLRTTPPLAGLLGASVLSQFDIDLDIPGGRMALFLAGECPVPPGVVLPLDLTRSGEAFIPVRVNGQALLAQIDTGSRPNILTTAAARRLGIAVPTSANTAPGIDGQRLPLGHTQIRLGLGDGPDAPTPVSIGPLQLERGEMLLGLDVLARQRMWISYARRQISFARPAP